MQPIQEEIFNINLTPGSIKSAMKSANAPSRDLWQVPPDSIRVIENFNVRIHGPSYAASVRTYADSMKSEGFYQHKPLAGYVAKEGDDQIIYITDGHTRLDAVKLAISEGAEITHVPVVVSQSGVSMEDLTVALVRGNSGQPLTPFELGIVCKRLAKYGYEIPVIAERIGVSSQYVNNLLSLMAAPIEIRNMVIEESVSATTAIEALVKYGDKATEKLLEAQGRATEAGKSKITQKHVDPDSEFKKAVKKESVEMYELLCRMHTDISGGNGNAVDYFTEVDQIIAKIKQSQPKAV